MPEITSKSGPYPWGTLEIGQFFLVPRPDEADRMKFANRISAAAAMRSRRHGGRFSVKTTAKSVKVTRVA